jgi:hypothetical protein
VNRARRRRIEPREREREHRRRRFRRTGVGGRHDRVDERIEPERAQMIVQADVPIRDDCESQTGGRERTASIRRARENVERERRDERGRELLRIERSICRAEKDPRAVTPEPRERHRIASFVRPRNVVRDLGAERVQHLRAGSLDPPRREGVAEPADGIPQRDERAVGVDRDRVDLHGRRVAAVRHFTPEEANAALEEVRPIVEQMVEQRRAHATALERQEELEGHIRGNGGGIPPATLAEAAAEVDREALALSRLVDDLVELGVQVKDVDEGLIDFPALRRGETVLLCWKLGEEDIQYWHSLEDGFAGRRPLPLDD